jgi:hypothetical protein
MHSATAVFCDGNIIQLDAAGIAELVSVANRSASNGKAPFVFATSPRVRGPLDTTWPISTSSVVCCDQDRVRVRSHKPHSRHWVSIKCPCL